MDDMKKDGPNEGEIKNESIFKDKWNKDGGNQDFPIKGTVNKADKFYDDVF